MEPEQINKERASFGTKVYSKEFNSRQPEQYTILGIWEADAQNNIISYLSPLGAHFLGICRDQDHGLLLKKCHLPGSFD